MPIAKLIYPTNVSVDGYIEDEHGAFDWFPVDDDVFAAHTELMQSAGTLLYGRRLYETMAVWETNTELAEHSAPFADFAAAWQSPSKVVYSQTLAAASTATTRIEREFNAVQVRDLKAAADRDLIIGGADLAGQAFAAGLIDEVQLYLWPLVVGGGKRGLPTRTRVDLELIAEQAFGNGVILLRYRPRNT